jgi:hypothetical protein
MALLELDEQRAIENIVADYVAKRALKKFFTQHEEYYTVQSRNTMNAIPKDLHEQARNHEQAKQYAAMAKAWGTAWAELEKAAKV